MRPLPKPQTSYIGNEAAVAAALSLLHDTRLLTITGPGGGGKTRLALAVAEASVPHFAAGVAWVDLDALTAPEPVPQAAAAALGVAEEPGITTADGWGDLLAEHLAEHQAENQAENQADAHLLLVLDNCEHLAAACAQLVNRLLPSARGLRVLVTSRVPLGAAGERVWPVPLLGLPPSGEAEDAIKQIAAADAVRLFCVRAAQVAPAFTLHERNAAAVAHICRLLDGLPLAIELAAARCNVLAPQQIAARLDDSLRLLARQGPASDARHPSLAAAIQWSYQLLSPAEQTLFARLAVFRGSFTLPAVEEVGTDAAIGRGQMLDLIADLADKSLLAVTDSSSGGDELRYRLLTPLRQFAADQLAAAGEHELWRGRHAAWALALAERAGPHLSGPQGAQWLQQLADEHDDLRGALEWCAAAPMRAPDGLRLAAALGRFWCLHGHLSEGKHWLQTFLPALPPDEEPQAQVNARNTLARIAFLESNPASARTLSLAALELARRLEYDEGVETAQISLGAALWELGDYPAARRELEEIVRYTRALGHLAPLARGLNSLGLVAQQQGDGRVADACFEESLSINRRLGDQVGAATALYNLAMQTGYAGDYARARLLYGEALALQTAVGNRSVVADIQVNLGDMAAAQGDYGTAAAAYEAARAIYDSLGTPGDNGYVYAGMGEVAFYQGRHDEAQRHYAAALELFRTAGNRRLIGRCLCWLGRIACRQGDITGAAALTAEALDLRRSIGHVMGILFSLDIGCAELALAAGEPLVAARLLGAVECARREQGRPREPVEAQEAERLIARLHEQISVADLTLCWSEGQEMALDEAAAYALDTLSPVNLLRAHSRRGRELRLFALGRGRVYRGDRLLTAADWTYSKARELVFYLLCHPNSTREQIGLAFWPDANAEQVRKRFSAALAHARSALGREHESIRLEDGCYRLDLPPTSWCDLHEFTAKMQAAQRLLRQGQDRQTAVPLLAEAAALYGGDLLEDMMGEEWPASRRTALQQQFLDALLLLGKLHQEGVRPDAAIAVYERAVAQDPYLEDAHLELIRCLARSGRRRDALRQYATLAAALAELDATPSPATAALAARIRRSESV